VKPPADASSSTEAYVTIQNPTTYDIEVLGASSDAAGAVELRQAGRDTPLTGATVPAYGVLEMNADGVYLLLRDLRRRLGPGDTVTLTIATDVAKLTVAAAVRNE
jgi:copper(I)-binding protein